MHVPIAVAAQFNGSSVDKSPYGDALVEMDWTVGQVLQALRDSGVDKDTLVVYMSDNGPWDVKCNLSGSKVVPTFSGLQRERERERSINRKNVWLDGMR